MSAGDNSFEQVAAALEAIDAKIYSTPPPSDADKQTLLASYDDLRLALDDIAMTDYASAADTVSEAAKMLADVSKSGVAQSLVQKALLSLGVAHTAPAEPSPAAAAVTPQTAGAAAKPPAAGSAQPAPATQPPAAVAVAGQGQMNDAGFALLRKWEGFMPFAYDDANDGKVMPGDTVRGTLTIGYGHTGADVHPGQTCTQADADQWLHDDTKGASSTVAQMATTKIGDNQFSALVCFVFNVGPGTFKKSSVLEAVNAGHFADVPARLALYNKTRISGQMVTSQGLTRRRAAEIALWLTPV